MQIENGKKKRRLRLSSHFAICHLQFSICNPFPPFASRLRLFFQRRFRRLLRRIELVDHVLPQEHKRFQFLRSCRFADGAFEEGELGEDFHAGEDVQA